MKMEKEKTETSKFSTYVILFVTLALGFTIGYYYNIFSALKSKTQKEVKKSSINLAVDQYGNLLMIDNTTGEYTIYEDSVGQSIFNLYARNIFGQHSVEQTNEKDKK